MGSLQDTQITALQLSLHGEDFSIVVFKRLSETKSTISFSPVTPGRGVILMCSEN